MRYVNQSRAQELGRKGERWFQSQLPKNWIYQRPSEDIGVDGVVVITEKGDLNGAEFKVQVKASKMFKRRGETLIVRNIKLGTLEYWIEDLSPVLLALFEEESKGGFFCWVLDLFDSTTLEQLYTKRQKTITLRVPISLTFNSTAWDSVRRRLRLVNRTITLLTMTSEIIHALMPNLYVLTLAVENLVLSQAAGDIMPDNRSQIATHEVPAHKAIIEALSHLAEEMKPASQSKAFFLEELSQYRSLVERIWFPFEEYVRGQVDSEDLQVNAKLRKGELWNLIFRVLAIIQIAARFTCGAGVAVVSVPIEPTSNFSERVNQALDSLKKEVTNRGFWKLNQHVSNPSGE